MFLAESVLGYLVEINIIATRAVQAAPEIPSARLADLLRTEGVMKKESLNNVNQ